MSLFTKAIKYGLVNKLISEARKPQNQQKVKDMFQQLMDKRSNKNGPRPA